MLNTTNDEVRISINIKKHVTSGYELEVGCNQDNGFGWQNILISRHKNKEIALVMAIKKLDDYFSEGGIIKNATADTIIQEVDRRVNHYETCKKGESEILKKQYSSAQTTLVTLKMWIKDNF